ncbi:MAG: isopenicillin N synthase family dioxygenase [Acidithiobacillus sp.]
MSYIPVIDLTACKTGNAKSLTEIGRIVDGACVEHGFLILTGHGIERSLIDALICVSKDFFSHSDAYKNRHSRPSPDHGKGYCGVKKEALSYSLDHETPPDIKESFSIGQVIIKNNSYYKNDTALKHFTENIWPDIEGFRDIYTEYYLAMEKLSAQVMSLFAIALELDHDYFIPLINRSISNLRVLHYPVIRDPFEQGQLRAGAHTDYGSLTILAVAEGPFAPYGLQVLHQNGVWSDVPMIPDSFIVNIGDLMMMWTNNRWKSTLHRVINPNLSALTNIERMSIAFFHQPNYDVLIEPLPGCIASNSKVHYPPVTSGQHLREKFLKTREI